MQSDEALTINEPEDGIEDLDAVVGRRLYQLRLEAGMSQTEMGALVGVSLQQWQKYERGKNRISPARLKVLSDSFGFPLADFFTDADMPVVPSEDGRQDRWTADTLKVFGQFSPEVRHRVLNLVRGIADVISGKPLPRKPGAKPKAKEIAA